MDVPYGNGTDGEGDGPDSAGLPPKKKPQAPKPPARTLASLGIRMEKARTGYFGQLMPPGHEGIDAGKVYPLPSDTCELYDLARLPLPRGMRSGYAQYIMRARKMYKTRCNQRNPARLEHAALDAQHQLEQIRKTGAKVKEEVAAVRAQVAMAQSTLTDLYGLIRSGHRKIMVGFVENTEVNGEKIEADTFIQASGKILSHIAKLGGISDEDKSEAETAVFEQAIQATRARIEAGQTVGLKETPGEAEH